MAHPKHDPCPGLQAIHQIAGYIRRTVIAEQSRFVDDIGSIPSRCFQRQFERPGHMIRFHDIHSFQAIVDRQ
jgi:hypothetical protein